MMISKKTLQKLVAVLLALILLSINFTVYGDAASEKTAIVDNNVSNIPETGDGTYSSYISLYANKEVSEADVKYQLSNAVLDSKSIEFEVTVKNSGLYNIGLSYKCLDESTADIRIGLKIDGKYPYDKAEKFDFPRMWCDEEGEALFDDAGNEYAPQQVQYLDYYYNEAIDENVLNGDKYVVYLSKGIHTVEILPVRGKIAIDYFAFAECGSLEEIEIPIGVREIN